MPIQFDLFDDRPRPKGDRFGHLFDIEVDGYMWRAMYHAPDKDDPQERMAVYRGLIGEGGKYRPVSCCRIVSMPYTTDMDEAIRNIRIGEAWINDGMAECDSVAIEDCMELCGIVKSCRYCRYADQPKESHPCMICEWTDGKPSEFEVIA